MSRSSKSRRYVSSLETLETRVVLSSSPVETLNSTALINLQPARMSAKFIQSQNQALTLAPGVGNYQARPRRITPNQRLIDQVNNSFASFQNDYLPVFSVYLINAPLTASSDGKIDPATAAMNNYLSQRTKLLSQELVRTLLLVPGFGKKQVNGGVPIMTFLDRKILGSINAVVANGTTTPAPSTEQSLSLFNSLNKLIPGSKPAEGTLPIYTSGAINAIQAANSATINAMGYAAYNTFGKPSHA